MDDYENVRRALVEVYGQVCKDGIYVEAYATWDSLVHKVSHKTQPRLSDDEVGCILRRLSNAYVNHPLREGQWVSLIDLSDIRVYKIRFIPV